MFLHMVVVSSIAVIANAANLPPFITPCGRHLLNLNGCISNNIEAAKPILAEGLPELSIPSLKHIVIPYSYLNRSNFEFGIWNFNVSGFENFNVLKVDADLRKNIFIFQIEFPFGEGIGQYGTKGNILNLNIDSTGLILANATKLILNLELKTKLILRNGHIYFQQVDRNLNINIDGVFKIYMYNLYLGNIEITEIMNRIFNENSYYIFEVLIPILENYFDSLLDKGIDTFFNTFTYDELLP